MGNKGGEMGRRGGGGVNTFKLYSINRNAYHL